MQITVSLRDKANRLVDEQKVSRIGVKGHLYEVVGDTDTYRVHLSYPEEASGRCGCPRNQNGHLCSHIVAASIYALANPPESKSERDPFAGII